jgi:ABC-type microcin C transport system permease subunit YejB
VGKDPSAYRGVVAFFILNAEPRTLVAFLHHAPLHSQTPGDAGPGALRSDDRLFFALADRALRSGRASGGRGCQPGLHRGGAQGVGFDQPLYVQYLRFIAHAVQGDFGISIRNREPVINHLKQRFAFTVQLSLLAILIAAAIGLIAGVISATRSVWSLKNTYLPESELNFQFNSEDNPR